MIKLSEIRSLLKDVQISQNNLDNKLEYFISHLNHLFEENSKIINKIELLNKEAENLKSQLKKNDLIENLKTYRLDKKIDQDILDNLSAALALESNCLYPGLYIGYNSVLVSSMVASNPLYIASWDKRFNNIILSKFNSVYNKRIRSYTLDHKRMFNFDFIPKESIGYILCWDVIPFLNTKHIKPLLKSFLSVLRPGGKLIFNFSNCEKNNQLELAENYICTYQTLHDLRQLCNDYGEFQYIDFNNDIDYIKITKQGTLDTIKSQAPASEIISRFI